MLKAKYYPNGSLVDTPFGGNASPGLKAINYGLELLKKDIIWRIGNGQKVRIWRDPWLPRNFSRRPITRRGRCRLKWVSELLDQYGNWDALKVNQTFLPIDAEEILKIRISMHMEEDFLAWHPDNHDRFYVRSACKLALSLEGMAESSSSSDQKSRSAWDAIWNCNVP